MDLRDGHALDPRQRMGRPPHEAVEAGGADGDGHVAGEPERVVGAAEFSRPGRSGRRLRPALVSGRRRSGGRGRLGGGGRGGRLARPRRQHLRGGLRAVAQHHLSGAGARSRRGRERLVALGVGHHPAGGGQHQGADLQHRSDRPRFVARRSLQLRLGAGLQHRHLRRRLPAGQRGGGLRHRAGRRGGVHTAARRLRLRAGRRDPGEPGEPRRRQQYVHRARRHEARPQHPLHGDRLGRERGSEREDGR